LVLVVMLALTTLTAVGYEEPGVKCSQVILHVNVTDSSGAPIEGINVTLARPFLSAWTIYTDQRGVAEFSVYVSKPSSKAMLYVNEKGYTSYEKKINIPCTSGGDLREEMFVNVQLDILIPTENMSSTGELMKVIHAVRVGHQGFNPFEEFDIVEQKEICGIPAYYLEKNFSRCRKLGITVIATESALAAEQKRIVIIQPGSSTKGEFLADGCESVAVWHARNDSIVVLIDRSATFITNATDCNDEPWLWQTEIDDNAYATFMARAIALHLSDGNVTIEKMAKIVVVIRGLSLGGTLALDCDASKYSKNPVTGPDGLIIVEAPVPFDPAQTDLIQRQNDYHLLVKQLLDGGGVYNNESKIQIGVTYLAKNNPYGEDLVPGVPNLFLWRDTVTNTTTYDPYAPTQEYCILAGNMSGLTHANETRVMDVVLSHCTPYYPWTHVERLTGLMGNVPGFEIDPKEVESPVLSIGFPKAIGSQGAHWIMEVLSKHNPNVRFLGLNNPGHAGDLNQGASKVWAEEQIWMEEGIKPNPLKRGDVNLDGRITTDDVVIIQQIGVSGKYDSVADVNDDGKVTSLDALIVLNFI